MVWHSNFETSNTRIYLVCSIWESTQNILQSVANYVLTPYSGAYEYRYLGGTCLHLQGWRNYFQVYAEHRNSFSPEDGNSNDITLQHYTWRNPYDYSVKNFHHKNLTQHTYLFRINMPTLHSIISHQNENFCETTRCHFNVLLLVNNLSHSKIG